MQHEDFNWRIKAEQQLIEAEKRHKKEQQAINYAEIALQIASVNKQRQAEKWQQSQQQFNASGGPAINDEFIRNAIEDKKRMQKQQKLNLLNQVTALQNANLTKKLIQLQADLETNEKVEQNLRDEQQRLRQVLQTKKEINKQAWDEQIKVQQDTAKVESLF